MIHTTEAMRKPVEIADGRVWSEAVEINAAWHCNISCMSCSHGSPSMARRFIDPRQAERDLGDLARWLRVEHVRVLGGEPLLHPDLPAVLAAARRTGIAGRVRVLTNGLRLAEQSDEFWGEVDEAHVSVYPNTARSLETRTDAIVAAAAASGTTLIFKHFGHFRLSFRNKDPDGQLARLVYLTCQIGNRWRCLTVESGRIYRCPQSAQLGIGQPALVEADSLRIDCIQSAEQLLSWIAQEEPLLSCYQCTGSAGRRHPHQALTPSARRRPAESEPLDHAYLAQLLADPDADNGCVSAQVRPL